MPAPLLAAEDLRVDIDGVPVCDGTTFRATGERVLVLGAPRALFEATVGLAAVVRGTLAVRGTSSSLAAARRIVAGAAMEPPTPPRWTVQEYVVWSARLSGLEAAEARAAADAALAKLQLGSLAKTHTSKLVAHARRATVIAAALATKADVIALEDPVGGLPDDVASTYAKVLVEALADRAWLVFAPRMPLTSPLALEADEAIVLTGSRVDAQGAPTEIAAATRRFVARVHGAVETLVVALEARGAHLELHGTHVLVDLGPEMTTSELLAACDGAEVAVLELLPLSRALL